MLDGAVVVFWVLRASSLSRKQYGGKRISMKCLVWSLLTRWIGKADFDRVVEQIKDRLGSLPLPIQMAWGLEENFRGVIDLFDAEYLVQRNR